MTCGTTEVEARYRERLREILEESGALMHLLRCLREVGLPDWRLVSGAVYQSVWNALTGRAADYGIRDYDVAYFDGADLSYKREDAVIRRVVARVGEPLAEQVEVRNQARVHLWYEARFGRPYAPLASTDESLGRYLATAHAVAVRLEVDDSLSIAAPFGLRDIFCLTVRRNPDLPDDPNFGPKAMVMKARWPELTIVNL